MNNESVDYQAGYKDAIADGGLTIKELVMGSHERSREAGWWKDYGFSSGQTIGPSDLKIKTYILGTKIALIHSEISEAMEGLRKNLMDDELPHRWMVEVELADAVIRIADLIGALGLDLEGAIREKWAYNAQRPDHKLEVRNAKWGKSF